MVAGKSRLFAAPLVVASAGMLGSAATAHAAGGLSITPAILEHRAKLGKVGSFTLSNTTNETLRVRVTVRPWIQRLDGKVFTNPRATLTRYVRATKRSFRMRGGTKRRVNLRMVRRASGGSLYGNIDILGKPTKTKGRKGIIPQYHLVSSLRLTPKKRKIRIRTGPAKIRSRTVVLPLRNLGNTIDPIGGTFTISGAGVRSGQIKPMNVVPRKLVTLPLIGTKGFAKGRYTVRATVTQAGRRFTRRTSFTIR
jgi:hypothetical protein